MSGGAKLCMRAFKMLAVAAVGAVVWTTLNWEDVTPEWQDITDSWEG